MRQPEVDLSRKKILFKTWNDEMSVTLFKEGEVGHLFPTRRSYGSSIFEIKSDFKWFILANSFVSGLLSEN